MLYNVKAYLFFLFQTPQTKKNKIGWTLNSLFTGRLNSQNSLLCPRQILEIPWIGICFYIQIAKYLVTWLMKKRNTDNQNASIISLTFIPLILPNLLVFLYIVSFVTKSQFSCLLWILYVRIKDLFVHMENILRFKIYLLRNSILDLLNQTCHF